MSASWLVANSRQVKDLKAENERLRVVLQRIVFLADGNLGDWEMARVLGDVARTALSATEPPEGKNVDAH